jgi:hypothetical protein
MEKENYICKHWDSKRETCLFNKKLAMEFLNSVGAVIKNGPKRTSVDPFEEWSKDDWDGYNEMMSKLASGISGLNLSTGKIGCDGLVDGINQFCKQWDSVVADVFRKAQAKNPDSIFILNISK